MTHLDRLAIAVMLAALAAIVMLLNESNMHLFRLTVLTRDARAVARAGAREGKEESE